MEIIRIKELKILDDYELDVTFDDGKKVKYDVKDDMETLPGYEDLRVIEGLWEKAQLDASRTCVGWNEYIDLPADIIYEYGTESKERKEENAQRQT